MRCPRTRAMCTGTALARWWEEFVSRIVRRLIGCFPGKLVKCHRLANWCSRSWAESKKERDTNPSLVCVKSIPGVDFVPAGGDYRCLFAFGAGYWPREKPVSIQQTGSAWIHDYPNYSASARYRNSFDWSSPASLAVTIPASFGSNAPLCLHARVHEYPIAPDCDTFVVGILSG